MSLLADLESDLEKLDKQISDLLRQRAQLDWYVRKARAEEALEGQLSKASKKGSQRAAVLGLVRQWLLEAHDARAGDGLTARQLHDKFQQNYVDLEYVTLRSHLHRMKEQGQIYSTKHGGVWRLTELRDKGGLPM